MNETRFVNPHQPQTLYVGTILCYVDAVFGLFPDSILRANAGTGLLIMAGLAAGGFGIANEKKWGYGVAIAAAIGQLLALFALFGFETFRAVNTLFALAFDVALVALLLHPMSRSYQRIWFK